MWVCFCHIETFKQQQKERSMWEILHVINSSRFFSFWFIECVWRKWWWIFLECDWINSVPNVVSVCVWMCREHYYGLTVIAILFSCVSYSFRIFSIQFWDIFLDIFSFFFHARERKLLNCIFINKRMTEWIHSRKFPEKNSFHKQPKIMASEFSFWLNVRLNECAQCAWWW